MATKEKVYVGELVRAEIKKQMLKNGFVISKLKDAGVEITDTVFSNKIYGERDQFQPNEIEIINAALGTDFK